MSLHPSRVVKATTDRLRNSDFHNRTRNLFESLKNRGLSAKEIRLESDTARAVCLSGTASKPRKYSNESDSQTLATGIIVLKC